MDVKSKKIALMLKELVELNNSFHQKRLIGDAFYVQLIQEGFIYLQCVLISIFPDSSNTYCGQIIRQDGNVIKFDIDLDSQARSSWEDITNEFKKLFEDHKITKPWSKEVIAYNLFCEMGLRANQL